MITWYFILIVYGMNGAGLTQVGPFTDKIQCKNERAFVTSQFNTNKATPCQGRFTP